MNNYSQNSNNYFENMLGETANICCANIPYFQIFIIPEKLPYYNKQGLIQKWEEFTIHNATKYLTLSEDNIQTSIHTPKLCFLLFTCLKSVNPLLTKLTMFIFTRVRLILWLVNQTLNTEISPLPSYTTTMKISSKK